MAGSSSQRGDAAVLLLAAKLANEGLVVLQPFCDSLPFDLAVFVEGVFYRFQVKRAQPYKNTPRFEVPFRKVNPRTRKDTIMYRYTEEHTDFLVGVVFETGDCYFFPIRETMHIKAVVQVDPHQTSAHAAYNRTLDPELYRNTLKLGGTTVTFGR